MRNMKKSCNKKNCICSHCGKIQIPVDVTEKEKFVIEQLINISVHNLNIVNQQSFGNNLEEYIINLNLLLQEYKNEKFLKNNQFIFEQNVLKCSCGAQIANSSNLDNIILEIKNNGQKYCSCCGKEILYI